jgi:3-hydroxyisobutyryl-CoA hydrolase
MRIGRNWSIAETFRREHQMAAKFMKKHDFNEGVTALLIEKRDAKWDPASLEDIYTEDKISEPFFEVADDPPKLELLNDKNYREYEHNFGVPTEKEVEDLVAEGIHDERKLFEHFMAKTRAKQGVREVGSEIIKRKTVPGEGSVRRQCVDLVVQLNKVSLVACVDKRNRCMICDDNQV